MQPAITVDASLRPAARGLDEHIQYAGIQKNLCTLADPRLTERCTAATLCNCRTHVLGQQALKPLFGIVQ